MRGAGARCAVPQLPVDCQIFVTPFPNGSPYPWLYPRPFSVTRLKEILLPFPRQGVEWNKASREEGEEERGGGLLNYRGTSLSRLRGSH